MEAEALDRFLDERELGAYLRQAGRITDDYRSL